MIGITMIGEYFEIISDSRYDKEKIYKKEKR